MWAQPPRSARPKPAQLPGYVAGSLEPWRHLLSSAFSEDLGAEPGLSVPGSNVELLQLKASWFGTLKLWPPRLSGSDAFLVRGSSCPAQCAGSGQEGAEPGQAEQSLLVLDFCPSWLGQQR